MVTRLLAMVWTRQQTIASWGTQLTASAVFYGSLFDTAEPDWSCKMRAGLDLDVPEFLGRAVWDTSLFGRRPGEEPHSTQESKSTR